MAVNRCRANDDHLVYCSLIFNGGVMVKKNEIALHDPNTHVYSWCGQELTLTPDIVRKYLVSGKGKVTDEEIMMFIGLCKFQKLNPFLKEAYLIKYGDSAPASMVTAKEVFLKRASRNELYEGHEVGITEDGKTAWAKVYKKGFRVPIKVEVDWGEYVGKKQDGTPNRQWKEKPKTMLKKVALVQALRESFPEDLHGLYSKEEMQSISNEQRRTFKPEVAMPQSTEEDIEYEDPPETVIEKEMEEETQIQLQEWVDKLTEPVFKAKILSNKMFKKKDWKKFGSDEIDVAIQLCINYAKDTA